MLKCNFCSFVLRFVKVSIFRIYCIHHFSGLLKEKDMDFSISQTLAF